MKGIKHLMRGVAAILLMLSASVAATAADGVVEISGETTYYDDGRTSRLDCMRLAAEQARIEALANKFGTIVVQNLIQTERISNGRETNDFLALNSSEVKGEWLGDTRDPEYEFSYGSDDNLIVKCKVRGKARPISNDAAEFEALVLRNGTDRRHADNRFRDGDEMYLLFNGAADGYITVFLEDESRTVYELLPYPGDTKSDLRLRRGKEYIFFSTKEGKGEFGPEEELILTADNGHTEYNRLYVVYSPEAYSRPVTTANPGGLNSISSRDFTRWLLKSRQKDSRMGVKTINMEINP